MRYSQEMLIWFAVVSALGGGASGGVYCADNIVEAWNSWIKHSGKLLLGGNEANVKDIEADMLDFDLDADSKLRSLRLEYVQNQILRKLRLRDRPWPTASAMGSLPLPVREGATMLHMNHPHDHDVDPHTEDFYGKTDQKVIFPEYDGLKICEDKVHPSSACINFSMPEDLQPQDITSSELWIYKEYDDNDEYNQTFIVTENTYWDTARRHRRKKIVAMHDTDVLEGWVKIDVNPDNGSWMSMGYVDFTITCRSCKSEDTPPISLLFSNRPFLVLNTRYNAKKRRIRQLECSGEIEECCRERFYVSFEELGWDDWILQPRGYHAHFCRGSCSTIAAVTLGGSYHHSVMKKIFHSNHPRRLELKPCCTPLAFSPLQLFYMDSNNTVTQKTLPNMIVESCGCL